MNSSISKVKCHYTSIKTSPKNLKITLILLEIHLASPMVLSKLEKKMRKRNNCTKRTFDEQRCIPLYKDTQLVKDSA